MDFRDHIRIITDFPKEGISYKDVTTLLKNGEIYRSAIDALVEKIKPWQPDVIVGPEARGFLFGAPVAYALGIGFVPVRKPGKLPANTIAETYALEYGFDTLEVHADAIRPGERVVIVDDLLATGGTMLATANLMQKIGADVLGMGFLIELTFLKGREKLVEYPVFSLVEY
ncbi:adenine phosphoribosyltransferase [Desulfosporosinus burensis]|uniref:adenine phosphoribosyltransferase n=1 Tax=Desulfosporosinus sp. BICA1-9 TaxID=1531958 RepID=UPI00054BAF4C|nr:adenine phosphoribosyltransferase [Desulfosporosinus sp. BICA1-9]KJS48529.1 MAG: adenine phosphoribosyltransferase [Peptococcaceae bacterium BRH_c23]KJS77946.1 MAG: adenine phosphoribosyltransferase [Desulfosporosinus sp. BICA1-9]HBW35050.1 adenine phosphoribosyltransferase [Desulfosporosinus sp.]